MGAIGKMISDLVQNGGQAANKMTNALKTLGDGNMHDGIKRIADYCTKTGIEEGFKAGSKSGTVKGVIIGTLATSAALFIGNEIRVAIKKNKENKAIKAEGEAIIKVLEEVAVISECGEFERHKHKIITERCILTPSTEADFDDLTPLLTSEKVRKYLGGVRPLESSLNDWRKSLQATNEYLFTVRLHELNTTIGLVIIAPHHNPIDMEISFLFLPEHWGNGYAGEAVKELFNFCKNDLKLKRVVSETQAANIRSRQMLERLGYVTEGEMERFGEKQCLYVYDLRL